MLPFASDNNNPDAVVKLRPVTEPKLPLPPAYTARPMPAPPATWNEPVCVVVALVVPASRILPVLNVPYTVVLVNAPLADSAPLWYHSRYLVSLARTRAAFVSVELV